MTDRQKSLGLAVSAGITIALGVVLLLLQLLSVEISSLIGPVLILGSIQWAVAVFSVRRDAAPFWGSVSAFLGLFTGVLMLLPATGKESIVPLLLAGYFIINGIVIVLYAGSAHQRQRRWEWVILAGALSGITSAVLFRVPELTGSFVALNFLALGLAMLGLGLRRRKKNLRRRGPRGIFQ